MDSGASTYVLNSPTYTNLTEKFLHCFSHIHPPLSKTITVANKVQVFTLFKSSSSLSFKTTENETIIPSTNHSYFHKRLTSTFSFLQLYVPTETTLSPSSCSVVIQTITNHSPTLQFGCIGYDEIPANLDLPSAYHVHDINSLVHSVFNSYYPTLAEPMPPSRSTSLPSSSSFELHNLQPTQIIQHSFPTPPYSNKHFHF